MQIFRCIVFWGKNYEKETLLQLKAYKNQELMERRDELSRVMTITKLHQAADFMKTGREISPEYMEEIFADSPKYLLNIVAQVLEALPENLIYLTRNH